ncbi:glycosyltransferase [Sulfurimonas sp. HSL-1716]|uniref:glycosyltransferase n=1 Tax=Hydrocurvibacter sulfurireducens TaxID=3131937 RepID=UPI0031FA3E33
MRVAVVVRSLKVGGMERVAVNLSEAFADAGDESHLIYFKDKKRAFTPKENVHFHHFNLDKALNLTIIGAFLGVVAKLLNGIFRSTYFIYSGILLAPVFWYKLKKLEKKFGRFDLIIMRGHGTFELIWPLKDDRVVQMVESVFIKHGSPLENFYIKCVYEGKKLAGVSSGVKEKIEEVLKITSVKAKSVNVVNNPLDIDDIRKKAEAYKPEIAEEYIISVGRVTPNKNITFLLESYKFARDHYNLALPLVIVGDGHDMQNVKQRIEELKLTSYVKTLGLLSNPYPWIKNASLLTSTSFAEGFGMVLIEALSCHTKIISTKSKGGVKDIMTGDLQSYLTDFDVQEFAKKMVETLGEEKEWDFDSYTQKFRPEAIVGRYKELYL